MEEKILISILRLTQEKNRFLMKNLVEETLISKNLIKKHLQTFLEKGLLNKSGKFFTISSTQKFMVVVEALKHGIPIDVLSKYLTWKDFEYTVQNILENLGYDTLIHQRLKFNGKTYEVDVVAFYGEIVLCIDCKHWKHGFKGKILQHIVENHLVKANILLKNIKKIGEKAGKKIVNKPKILPMIICLTETQPKIFNGVPVVPILKLKSFLEGFYGYLDQLRILKSG